MFHFVYLIRAYASRRAVLFPSLVRRASETRSVRKINRRRAKTWSERRVRLPVFARLRIILSPICFVLFFLFFFFRLREGLSWERGTARSRLC